MNRISIALLFALLLKLNNSYTQCPDSTLRLDVDFSNGFIDNSLYQHAISVPSDLLNAKTTDRNGDSTTYLWSPNYSSNVTIHSSNNTMKPELPITISMWVNIDALGFSHRLFTNETINGNYSGVWLSVGSNGNVSAGFGNGGSTTSGASSYNTATSSKILNVQEWYHLVCIYRGNNDIDIYINNFKDAVTYTGTAINIGYNSPNYPSTIGWYNKNGIGFTNGKIDDIKMWSKELSASEINKLYSGLDIDPTMVIHRNFDNYNPKYSANSFPVYPWNNSPQNPDRFGIDNSVYRFTGNSGFANNSPLPLLSNITYPFSFSAWLSLADSSETSGIYSNADNPSKYSGFFVRNNQAGKMLITMGDGISNGLNNRRTAQGSKILNSGKWHHVAIIAHSYNDIEMYIDGISTNVSYSGNSASMAPSTGSETLGEHIGFIWGGNNTRTTFNGKIDDIRVWNRAILQDEIMEIYNELNPNLIIEDSLEICLGELDTLNLNYSSNQICAEQFRKADGNIYSGGNVIYPIQLTKDVYSYLVLTATSKSGRQYNDTIYYKVNSTPAVTLTSNADSICNGDSLTLNVSATNITLPIFNWDIGSIQYNDTTSSIKIAINSSNTIIQASLVDNENCSTTQIYGSNQLTPYVYDLPNTSVSQNNGILSVDDTLNNFFQWLNCDNNYSPIVNETDYMFTDTAGNFAVQITSINGCTATSNCNEILHTTVDITNLSNTTNHLLYPNPNNGVFTLKLGDSEERMIKIFNILGNEVYSLQTLKSNVNIILNNNISKGFHLVKIYDGQTVTTLPFKLVH